jgi:demethylmenaquinone methyltransferase/2-methoxy-6-polyprenyl-1,4-benzoquinol methylase
VLEIGFGTGRCLWRVAEAAGRSGRVHGIDISPGMITLARRRLERAGVRDNVGICRGDAALLPYRDAAFDACFMNFTLELFDTPEIPEILGEARRVLKPKGRIGVASLSRERPQTPLLKLYEWGHRRWPAVLDCRPIYLERALREASYTIRVKERLAYLGIPVEVVVGVRDETRDAISAT